LPVAVVTVVAVVVVLLFVFPPPFVTFAWSAFHRYVALHSRYVAVFVGAFGAFYLVALLRYVTAIDLPLLRSLVTRSLLFGCYGGFVRSVVADVPTICCRVPHRLPFPFVRSCRAFPDGYVMYHVVVIVAIVERQRCPMLLFVVVTVLRYVDCDCWWWCCCSLLSGIVYCYCCCGVVSVHLFGCCGVRFCCI